MDRISALEKRVEKWESVQEKADNRIAALKGELTKLKKEKKTKPKKKTSKKK